MSMASTSGKLATARKDAEREERRESCENDAPSSQTENAPPQQKQSEEDNGPSHEEILEDIIRKKPVDIINDVHDCLGMRFVLALDDLARMESLRKKSKNLGWGDRKILQDSIKNVESYLRQIDGTRMPGP